MNPTLPFRSLALAAALWLSTGLAIGAPEPPPRVLDAPDPAGSKSRGPLNDWLAGEVASALDRRLDRFENVIGSEKLEVHAAEMRQVFLDSLGGLPEDTPLDARVTGAIDGNGYRIERVLYHSVTGFPVTANLYLPDSPGRHPAVLHSCGHSAEGKATETYQLASALLAHHGIAVLCVDPLGQGERKQLEASGVTGSTTEHMLMGVAPILLGRNLATWMIHDGLRGIDYLVSRPEIDPARIGAMGNSGGGMMTSYLMALDPRIRAAAPACFITNTRRKNRSPGPGDAEQNLFAQSSRGLDHADFLLMRAPRPTLILSATRDFVPIEGTWESFRQAKRAYGVLGFPERVDLAEVNERHGFSPGLRVAAARWMSRWLLDRDEAVPEPQLPVHPAEELHVTETGSVLDLPGARSFFDVITAEADRLAGQREERWAHANREERLVAIRSVLGLASADSGEAASWKSRGEVSLGGIDWETRLYQSESGVLLPALAAHPEGAPRGAILRVDGTGRAGALAEGESIADWLDRDFLVVLADLRGYGETRTNPWRYGAVTEAMGPNSAEAFLAYMLGRSLVEMRTRDLLQVAHAMREQLPAKAPLHLMARGHAAVPAWHAAALERDGFGRIDIEGGPESWQALCRGPVFDGGQLENAVHGALRVYDLPDLRELARPSEFSNAP